jgi:hypothetical protein
VAEPFDGGRIYGFAEKLKIEVSSLPNWRALSILLLMLVTRSAEALGLIDGKVVDYC